MNSRVNVRARLKVELASYDDVIHYVNQCVTGIPPNLISAIEQLEYVLKIESVCLEIFSWFVMLRLNHWNTWLIKKTHSLKASSIDWFWQHVKLFRVILCQEVRKSRSLYVPIYIFVLWIFSFHTHTHTHTPIRNNF